MIIKDKTKKDNFYQNEEDNNKKENPRKK